MLQKIIPWEIGINMKQEFSSSWLSSKQPRKQRKFRANSGLHTKHKFLSAHLSKPLREKYGKRSLPLRKGDEVLVMRGNSRKKTGKISVVDLKNSRVAIEGIQRSKRDGSKVNLYFRPSALLIQSASMDDKERKSAVERSSSKKGAENAPNKAGNHN